MRVLIVGCGYVGISVGKELAQAGHEVWGMRRTAESRDALEQQGIRPLMADITQPESLKRLTGDYDWVVHCVASGGGAVEDYRQVYLEGTRNLLAWVRGRHPQKLVYTSSTSVYGQIDGGWVDETSPTEPESGTGKILLEAEGMLLSAGAMVLRVAGIYGPGRGYWLKQFLSGEARLEGTGDRFLNMIHRDDVAGAIIASLERGEPGRIYNTVDDEPVQQRVLFEWLAKRLGRPMPQPGLQTARKRGFTNKRVSNRRLKEELGYRLRYPTLREGYGAEEMLNR